MQRTECNGASRASSEEGEELRRERRGGGSKERSAKGATRGKMVEEMACKRGFVGKRTEPVVRRHLAAPYIFLSFFLPSSLSPSSSRRHHGSSPSCCSPPSQHFHLYLPSYVSPFPLHIQILRPTLIRLLNFPITYQPRNPVILSLLSRRQAATRNTPFLKGLPLDLSSPIRLSNSTERRAVVGRGT